MKLDDLKDKEIEINENGFLKVVEKKTGKFIPNEDERYWFVNEYGEINYAVYSDLEMLQWTINHHPVFRKEEEAEEYRRYLDVLDKYKHEFSDEEWKNKNIEKWYLFFMSEYRGGFYCRLSYTSKHPNCVYFKSEENAVLFIKEVGEENVKKFMFDIWE